MKVAAKQYLAFLLMMTVVAAVLSTLPENGIASPLSELTLLAGGAVLLSFGKAKTQWNVPVLSAATFCLLVGIAQFYALGHEGAHELGRVTDRITMNVGEFPMGVDAPWIISFPVWTVSLVLLAVGAWTLSLPIRLIVHKAHDRSS